MPTTTVTLRASASTRTAQSVPSKSLSAAAQTLLYMHSNQSYSYLQFGLPRDFRGSTVISAKLWICALDPPPAAGSTIGARLIAKAFGASTTWNNQPGVLSGSVQRNGGLRDEATSAFWFEVDVTDDFAAVAAGGVYHGHRLSLSQAAFRSFYGRAHPAGYPRLILTYATDTPAPAAVTPDGVTSLQRPVFTWAAPNDITMVQAQAAAVGSNFSAPTWSSGSINSSIGQVNTATAGWAGLAEGASADLRFRQLGPLGWSAWSAPVTVTRRSYPAAAAVVPPPSGTTNDPTPPHQWTFANQTKFRLVIVLANNASVVVYDSGEIAGNDHDWTPAINTAKVPDGAVLRSSLRLWDNRTDRVASPGDFGFLVLNWNWTYNPDAATPVATGLVATVQPGKPVARLTWNRSAGEPDEWIILRNGVMVGRFPGAQGKTGATSWAYEDPTCPPNQAVTYAVRALVGGKVSLNSNLQVVNQRVPGVAIFDPVTGTYFNVAGEGAADNLERTESTATYRGPFSQTPVKRVMALGGISGPVSGQLHQSGDRAMATQLAAVRAVRENPTRVFRLVYGLVNVPVLVSNLSAMLASDAIIGRQMTHRISFTVDQCGEFDTEPAGEGA